MSSTAAGTRKALALQIAYDISSHLHAEYAECSKHRSTRHVQAAAWVSMCMRVCVAWPHMYTWNMMLQTSIECLPWGWDIHRHLLSDSSRHPRVDGQ